MPFIQTVHRFDKRWLEFDGDANEIPTKDKKYIWVDTYARWRIADPLRFFQAVRDERGGQSRLDDIVDGETRNAVASFDLIEIVRSTNRDVPDHRGAGGHRLRGGHGHGRRPAAARSRRSSWRRPPKITPEFGIELVDVRFKRINYVDTVQQKVFERMISERKRIAERSRSEGQGRAAEIRGPEGARHAGRQSSVGYKPRAGAEGRGRRARPPPSTPAPTAATPEFYQFLKRMETLNASLDDKAVAHPLHRLGAAEVPEGSGTLTPGRREPRGRRLTSPRGPRRGP